MSGFDKHRKLPEPVFDALLADVVAVLAPSMSDAALYLTHCDVTLLEFAILVGALRCTAALHSTLRGPHRQIVPGPEDILSMHVLRDTLRRLHQSAAPLSYLLANEPSLLADLDITRVGEYGSSLPSDGEGRGTHWDLNGWPAQQVGDTLPAADAILNIVLALMDAGVSASCIRLQVPIRKKNIRHIPVVLARAQAGSLFGQAEAAAAEAAAAAAASSSSPGTTIFGELPLRSVGPQEETSLKLELVSLPLALCGALVAATSPSPSALVVFRVATLRRILLHEEFSWSIGLHPSEVPFLTSDLKTYNEVHLREMDGKIDVLEKIFFGTDALNIARVDAILTTTTTPQFKINNKNTDYSLHRNRELALAFAARATASTLAFAPVLRVVQPFSQKKFGGIDPTRRWPYEHLRPLFCGDHFFEIFVDCIWSELGETAYVDLRHHSRDSRSHALDRRHEALALVLTFLEHALICEVSFLSVRRLMRLVAAPAGVSAADVPTTSEDETTHAAPPPVYAWRSVAHIGDTFCALGTVSKLLHGFCRSETNKSEHQQRRQQQSPDGSSLPPWEAPSFARKKLHAQFRRVAALALTHVDLDALSPAGNTRKWYESGAWRGFGECLAALYTGDSSGGVASPGGSSSGSSSSGLELVRRIFDYDYTVGAEAARIKSVALHGRRVGGHVSDSSAERPASTSESSLFLERRRQHLDPLPNGGCVTMVARLFGYMLLSPFVESAQQVRGLGAWIEARPHVADCIRTYGLISANHLSTPPLTMSADHAFRSSPASKTELLVCELAGLVADAGVRVWFCEYVRLYVRKQLDWVRRIHCLQLPDARTYELIKQEARLPLLIRNGTLSKRDDCVAVANQVASFLARCALSSVTNNASILSVEYTLHALLRSAGYVNSARSLQTLLFALCTHLQIQANGELNRYRASNLVTGRWPEHVDVRYGPFAFIITSQQLRDRGRVAEPGGASPARKPINENIWCASSGSAGSLVLDALHHGVPWSKPLLLRGAAALAASKFATIVREATASSAAPAATAGNGGAKTKRSSSSSSSRDVVKRASGTAILQDARASDLVIWIDIFVRLLALHVSITNGSGGSRSEDASHTAAPADELPLEGLLSENGRALLPMDFFIRAVVDYSTLIDRFEGAHLEETLPLTNVLTLLCVSGSHAVDAPLAILRTLRSRHVTRIRVLYLRRSLQASALVRTALGTRNFCIGFAVLRLLGERVIHNVVQLSEIQKWMPPSLATTPVLGMSGRTLGALSSRVRKELASDIAAMAASRGNTPGRGELGVSDSKLIRLQNNQIAVAVPLTAQTLFWFGPLPLLGATVWDGALQADAVATQRTVSDRDATRVTDDSQNGADGDTHDGCFPPFLQFDTARRTALLVALNVTPPTNLTSLDHFAETLSHYGPLVREIEVRGNGSTHALSLLINHGLRTKPFSSLPSAAVLDAATLAAFVRHNGLFPVALRKPVDILSCCVDLVNARRKLDPVSTLDEFARAVAAHVVVELTVKRAKRGASQLEEEEEEEAAVSHDLAVSNGGHWAREETNIEDAEIQQLNDEAFGLPLPAAKLRRRSQNAVDSYVKIVTSVPADGSATERDLRIADDAATQQRRTGGGGGGRPHKRVEKTKLGDLGLDEPDFRPFLASLVQSRSFQTLRMLARARFRFIFDAFVSGDSSFVATHVSDDTLEEIGRIRDAYERAPHHIARRDERREKHASSTML